MKIELCKIVIQARPDFVVKAYEIVDNTYV